MDAPHTLARSPLVMVLSQVRFPREVINLKPANAVAIDAAMNSAGFPMMKSDATASFNLGEVATLQLAGPTESRMFFSGDLSLGVTVNPRFLSVYCVDNGAGIPYPGHEVFIERVYDVVSALEQIVGEVIVERLGYRYVDALCIEDAKEVLKDPFRGAEPLLKDDTFPFSVTSTTVDAYFSNSVGQCGLGSEPPLEGVHVVCGTVVPRLVIDPAIPPKPDSRWIVDIDAYTANGFALSGDAIRQKARQLANMGRGIFYNRIVTERFAEKFDD